MVAGSNYITNSNRQIQSIINIKSMGFISVIYCKVKDGTWEVIVDFFLLR